MSYPDLNSLCRLCLSKEKGTINIFETNEDSPIERPISVPMRIMACVSLEVHASDALPKVICRACRYQLEKSFVFRKRAQIAETKLRKHIRLLNAGRASNVFFKREDDDDEEELELEDSLIFLKKQEKDREQEKQKMLNTVREEHVKELEKVKNNFAKETKERLAAMKKDMLGEAMEKIRNEVKIKLRVECMSSAKEEVRAELKEECQRIEKENLIKDLELFLNQQKFNTTTTPNKSKESPKINLKLYKRTRSPENNSRSLRSKKNNSKRIIEIDDTEQVLQETFEVITKDMDDEKGVVFDSDSNHFNEEFIENNDDDNDEGSDEDIQFSIASDNHNADLAIYEIKENGDIQTLDKDEDGDVLYLNMSEVVDNDDDGLLEFVDLKDGKKQNKSTTVFLSTDSNDKTNICGYTKVTNKNDAVKSENVVTDVMVYGTATDTPKTFKCDLCPVVFSTENAHKRHCKTHEKGEKKGIVYKCPECKMCLSCRSALNRHMILHTGARPYKCEECGKSFVQREILKRHQKVHTGERPHKCPLCPRAYTQKVNLQQHMNHLHSNMPNLHQHTCHLCPKRFNHASGLSRHLTTHSGITYECIRCSRKFGDRSSVKRHLQTVHSVSANKFIKECSNDEKQNIENNET